MLAYSLFYSNFNLRGEKTTIWSLKIMKRKGKEVRGSEGEKVGDLNRFGRSRDGVAYGDWVNRRVGFRRCNPLLREKALRLAQLRESGWSGSRVLHMPFQIYCLIHIGQQLMPDKPIIQANSTGLWRSKEIIILLYWVKIFGKDILQTTLPSIR